jgi:uncharacterized protein YndB with AHSA1/START domain
MFRVWIRASIQEVWDEITRTDAPILCFFNSRMDAPILGPGARLAMRSPDGKYTGVVGEIFVYEPPHRFGHSFRFTNFDDPPCKVLSTLVEKDGGVEYTLTITELPLGTKTAKQMVQGDKMIVSTLKSVIETGKPPFGIRMLYVLFKLMQPLTPKKCLSEHWPVESNGMQR